MEYWWTGALAAAIALAIAVAFFMWGKPHTAPYRLPEVR